MGYVWERTFDRILKSVTEARPDGEAPWVATLPARLVDYGPLSELFSGYGLVTEKLSTRTFPQRRFAAAAERDRAFYAGHRNGGPSGIVGADSAANAVRYALRPVC